MTDTTNSEDTGDSFYVKRRAAIRPENPSLSIIVPVYNEEEVVDLFVDTVNETLADEQLDIEYIFIDDGSKDNTAALISKRLEAGLKGRLIGLSRNFGKEAALSAGLAHAHGDIAIPIDADLQDPPKLIPQMIDAWRQGYDVVYGLRVDRRSDSATKRNTSSAFYSLFNRIAHIHLPSNAGDFRLIDRCVIETLKNMPERNRFMKGLFAWAGFSSIALPYERPPRVAGHSKFNYWRLWNFALDGFVGFSSMPLRIWLYFGSLIAAISLVYTLFIIARVMIYGVDVPGYASLMSAVLFFSGIQLISVGVIGEYVARLFTETKQRPIYVVKDVVEGSEEDRHISAVTDKKRAS
ncbi:MAG: glycosyltransferase family 2 protein [Stappiaceae bacterium]